MLVPVELPDTDEKNESQTAAYCYSNIGPVFPTDWHIHAVTVDEPLATRTSVRCEPLAFHWQFLEKFEHSP